MPFDVRKSFAFPTEPPTVLRLRRRYGAANHWPRQRIGRKDGGIAAYKVVRAAGEAQLRRTSTGKARKPSCDTAAYARALCIDIAIAFTSATSRASFG